MSGSRRLEKKQLRKFFLSLRKEIPPAIRSAKNATITNHLLLSDSFAKAKRVFSYLSLPDEVETDKIIEEALKARKEVFAPIITENQLIPAPLKNLKEVEKGPLGIRQPIRQPKSFRFPTEKIDFDLIIVPGVAFDRRFFRLGFGKGYFDRFLVQYKRKTTIVGLAFKEQIVDKLPTDFWDVPLDKILTDEGWLNS